MQSLDARFPPSALIIDSEEGFTSPIIARGRFMRSRGDVNEKKVAKLLAKPYPEVIGIIQNPPEQCLMVGDAPSDMEAGRRAGVKTCGVRYGYGDLEAMAEFTPDFWIDHPLQLSASSQGSSASDIM